MIVAADGVDMSRTATQTATLRERFEAFVQTLEGFEDIDLLLQNQNLPGKKRADYFFQGRKIIVEQKSLEADPADKPQKFVEQLVQRGQLLFYGTLSTEAIFSRMRNGDELRRQLTLKIAKIIDDNVRNADKQTRDTREIFTVPDAGGVLVLLNETATTLFPDVVTYALNNSFTKKNGNDYRYPHNDAVFLISEAHPVDVPGFQKTFPIHSFLSPGKRNQETVIPFMEMLKVRWAQFNGAMLVDAPAPSPAKG